VFVNNRGDMADVECLQHPARCEYDRAAPQAATPAFDRGVHVVELGRPRELKPATLFVVLTREPRHCVVTGQGTKHAAITAQRARSLRRHGKIVPRDDDAAAYSAVTRGFGNTERYLWRRVTGASPAYGRDARPASRRRHVAALMPSTC